MFTYLKRCELALKLQRSTFIDLEICRRMRMLQLMILTYFDVKQIWNFIICETVRLASANIWNYFKYFVFFLKCKWSITKPFLQFCTYCKECIFRSVSNGQIQGVAHFDVENVWQMPDRKNVTSACKYRVMYRLSFDISVWLWPHLEVTIKVMLISRWISRKLWYILNYYYYAHLYSAHDEISSL